MQSRELEAASEQSAIASCAAGTARRYICAMGILYIGKRRELRLLSASHSTCTKDMSVARTDLRAFVCNQEILPWRSWECLPPVTRVCHILRMCCYGPECLVTWCSAPQANKTYATGEAALAVFAAHV